MAKGLTRFPKLKRVMKNVYAYTGNILSDKKTDMPGMIQISSDGADHNFGYYDKSPRTPRCTLRDIAKTCE